MNAIGTQVRDPINSGLARWRIAVLVFKLSSKVNIWYYIAKSIRADIVCRCVLVAFLNVDLCKR